MHVWFWRAFSNSNAKRKQFVQIVGSVCIWWARKFMQCHLFLNYDSLFVCTYNATKSRAVFPIHCVCVWNFSALMKASKNDKSHCFRILIILSRFGNRKERTKKGKISTHDACMDILDQRNAWLFDFWIEAVVSFQWKQCFCSAFIQCDIAIEQASFSASNKVLYGN